MGPGHVALKLKLRFYEFAKVYVFYLATLISFLKDTFQKKLLHLPRQNILIASIVFLSQTCKLLGWIFGLQNINSDIYEESKLH